MKHFALILPVFLAGMFATGRTCAQEPAAPKQATDIQLLQKQMLQIQAGMKQMQAQHQQELEALKRELAEGVQWETAQYTTKKAIIHT